VLPGEQEVPGPVHPQQHRPHHVHPVAGDQAQRVARCVGEHGVLGRQQDVAEQGRLRVHHRSRPMPSNR
jgi:hypothetical protein